MTTVHKVCDLILCPEAQNVSKSDIPAIISQFCCTVIFLANIRVKTTKISYNSIHSIYHNI